MIPDELLKANYRHINIGNYIIKGKLLMKSLNYYIIIELLCADAQSQIQSPEVIIEKRGKEE